MTEADLIAYYGITAAELQAGCLVDPAKVSESRRISLKNPTPAAMAELAALYTHNAFAACGDLSNARMEASWASQKRLMGLQLGRGL